MKDYELYFVTFTFENQFQELFTDIYKDYFKALYQKINQYTINNPSYNSHLKAKMVLIPEKSNDTKAQTLVRGCHYHGILMQDQPYNDGTGGISSCIIGPMQTFVHTFVVDNPGTHYWHGHTSLDRMDGLQGAIIVEDPNNPDQTLSGEQAVSFDVNVINDVERCTVADGKHAGIGRR